MGIRYAGDSFGSATIIPAKRPAPGSVATAPGRWVVTILGWHPVSDNKLKGHRMKIHRLKMADAAVIAAEFHNAGVTKATGRRRVSVVVYQDKGRPLDGANLNKSLRDAMVQSGGIVDDSAKWAEFVGPDVEKGRKATVITIEDI